MELHATQVERYLSERMGEQVGVLDLEPLGDDGSRTHAGEAPTRTLKTFGYGKPVLVRYMVGGREHRAVFNTVAPGPFGHEMRADRAAGCLLSYDIYGGLPQHARALDVGALTPDGLQSLGEAGEFFLLTEFVEGELYARDLVRLRDGCELSSQDRARSIALASYLARIHAVRRDDPALYRRHLRDALGSGEGLMGLTDSYPPAYALANRERLERIEQAAVRWRWRLKEHPERLAQIHGDFHPFNILFGEGSRFTLLDRSRAAWGEPADDVSCLTINYLFFSLQRHGRLADPFLSLWDGFWDCYLTRSGDPGVLERVAPFFAWRGLVVASPLWYDIPDTVRVSLLHFIEAVLAEERFDPASANHYLGVE